MKERRHNDREIRVHGDNITENAKARFNIQKFLICCCLHAKLKETRYS